MQLPPDFKEFLELAISANVRLLLIGGWAFNRYAEPRMTGDIDFFLDGSPETEKIIRGVLAEFGFGSVLPPTDVSLFIKPILMLGHPPNRIDLLTKIDGISFEQAWKNRNLQKIDDILVPVISLQDLIQNKLASGRPKDLSDVDVLRPSPE